MSVQDLQQLRRNLVEAQLNLSTAKKNLPGWKALAETAIIEATLAAYVQRCGENDVEPDPKMTGWKLLGGNEDERDREMRARMAVYEPWRVHQTEVEALEAQVAVLELELDIERDGRRELEWSIRERMVTALEQLLGTPVDEVDASVDQQFTTHLLDLIANRLLERIASRLPAVPIETVTSTPTPVTKTVVRPF